MSDDPKYPAGGDDMRPAAGARRVSASRAERGHTTVRTRGGRRKAPQPGKVVVRVILSSLLSLGLATGLGVVLVYNNWNGNITRKDVSQQLTNRPVKEEVAGPQEPLTILVMGSDSRSGKGNAIDGEKGGGLSDTTILFHISADRKFAYGVSIPRDTAVMRPACKDEKGRTIPASSGYRKWNEAFALGGPGCTYQQVEQLTGIRVDHYVVVDFNGFRDMVDALDGVEVCIPEDIDDNQHNIHLKKGTREVRGREALAYVRVRYRVGEGTDTDRTRRQQAFIASMINKALTAGMLSRPDRLVDFINAATSSLKTDFPGIAQMANLALTAKGIGPSNIKFVTTPWVYSDKVSGGIEWKPEVDKLWRLIRKDKPLTPEFLKDSLSAGDEPDGTTSAVPSGSASATPSESASPSGSATPGTEPNPGAPSIAPVQNGLDARSREAVGLCS